MVKIHAIAKIGSGSSVLGIPTLFLGLCLATLTYPATCASEPTPSSIDVEADEAIGHFEARVAGINNLIARSQGVLVLPTVGMARCLRHQTSSPGALRVNGQPQQKNYILDADTIDLECDHHPVSLFVLFMSKQALDTFVSRMHTRAVATETGTQPLLDAIRAPDVLTYVLLDNGIIFGTRYPIRAYRSAPSSSKA